EVVRARDDQIAAGLDGSDGGPADRFAIRDVFQQVRAERRAEVHGGDLGQEAGFGEVADEIDAGRFANVEMDDLAAALGDRPEYVAVDPRLLAGAEFLGVAAD